MAASQTQRAGECTESEDCDQTLIVREHGRDPQIGTQAHNDAPTEEHVCPVHGVVKSW